MNNIKYKAGDKLSAIIMGEECKVEVKCLISTDEDYWVNTPYGEEFWDDEDFNRYKVKLINK